MKTISRKSKLKKTPEETINDRWLEIHVTAHKVVKSKDEKEIAIMRLKMKRLLKKIRKVERIKDYERKFTEIIKKQ